MKLKFLIVIVLLNFSSVFSQDDKTVTLTVSAQGATLSEAKQNALRDAIEQAFGAFVSSNTEILNDELVKDEIVSVSNGNIQDYEVISQLKLPNGNYAITLKANVSINKLSAFVESKGVEVEFKGGLLAVNVKQQILNEKNEVKTIENIDNVCRKILDKSYDYEIIRGTPKQAKSSNGWTVPLQIDVKFNENIEQFRDYFYSSVGALSMSESEIQKYQDLGKPTFTIGLGMGDELGGVWNSNYSVPIKQQIYTSKKKLIESIKQYFDSLKQKHPLKNTKYQLRVIDNTKLDTENIGDILAWIKNSTPSPFLSWLNSVNERRGIDIIYTDVSVRSTYTFRTKATRDAILTLIFSIKNSSLNFKITNGVQVIDRTYFDEQFNSFNFRNGYDQFPIISNKPVIEGVNFSPILYYHIIKNGFWWGGNGPVNNRPHPGYASLYKLKFSFTQNMNISKRFRGTKKFNSPGCYDFNIPIISLYDFNNTDKVILSLYYENLLTLSELEQVKSYQIYPTHNYLQSVKKNTKVSNNNQVSDKSNEASVVFKSTHYVNDPDGWTNFRDAPRGKILKRLDNKLQCKFLSSENGWTLVELKSSEKGYIHSTRLKSNSSKIFKIKIQKNRTNINVRKKPVNGVVVGQVSGGELYTVTNESVTDTPIYLLNNDMVLTDFKTGEKIDKSKDFKLNNVREHINNTYYAEIINTDETINKVYIEKNKVKIEYNSWFYLEEIKGWIYSVFCEKI